MQQASIKAFINPYKTNARTSPGVKFHPSLRGVTEIGGCLSSLVRVEDFESHSSFDINAARCSGESVLGEDGWTGRLGLYDSNEEFGGFGEGDGHCEIANGTERAIVEVGGKGTGTTSFQTVMRCVYLSCYA